MPRWEKRTSGIFAPRQGRLEDAWLQVDGPDPHYAYFEDLAGGTLKVRHISGGDNASGDVVLVALVADGPTVGATATEFDLLPAQALPTIPGLSYWSTGKAVRVTCSGTIVTGAAPGNASLRVRYGASSTTGVVLADSGAIALTASIAVVWIWRFSVIITFRGPVSTAAPTWSDGNGAGLTSNIVPAQFHMGSAGQSAPAAVNIDATVNTNAFRPTVLMSAAVAANAFVCRKCVIESMN